MLAIVPVKGLDRAKTRLAPVLTARERAALVVEMLDRVLAACGEADAIGRTLLVTPDPGLARPGAELLVDAGDGHAEAIALALARPEAAGGALVVMADCPLVTASSLDALAAAARPLALAPSRDGGVNALALRAANGFRPRFGVPAAETVAAARAAGLEPAILDDPALALDVDRPDDYELLLASA
ncbi:MAG TPA: 2-phospho-L-lactate guanylyltransferase [Gaiellaceae bacterium]|nr:2-phospho-L-lactate guanylyltransferase [Gaiellaceae bacterium]